MSQNKHRLMVVCQYFGLPSQTWINRQIDGFSKHNPVVVTWKVVGEPLLSDVAVMEIKADPEPYAGNGRWLFRLRHAMDWNFFGALGADRRMLERAIETHRPNVILCHFGHVGLRLIRIASAKGIPLVAHFHGMDLSSMLTKWFYRSSLRRYHRRFAASIIVGAHHFDVLRSLGLDNAHTHLIPCGVPTNEFKPSPRSMNSPVRFITVGRLERVKGVRESIRAFAAIAHTFPGTTLTVVGDGIERGSLQALVDELALRERIRFTGALPPNAVRDELQNADIFLHHSLLEGFGVSVAEASAMELPIIATNTGGIRDQVVDGETGLLVEPLDLAAMAAAMARLAAAPALRRDLGAAGRRRMVESYDTAGQIEKLERVLSSVCPTDRKRPADAALRSSDPARSGLRHAYRMTRMYVSPSNWRKARFVCPCCQYQGPFLDLHIGAQRRFDARCPACGALERHRLQRLVFDSLFAEQDTDGLALLHFAPEPIFRELFGATFARYETADLGMEGVDHHVNLERLPFPAQSFDVVFASHVLEHVPNDAAAIAEIKRILKPDGMAILPVPITSERTIEYGEARADEHNHVRSPGPDYLDRYRSVFAEVAIYTSDQYPEHYQLYARGTKGRERVGDLVPVCYVSGTRPRR